MSTVPAFFDTEGNAITNPLCAALKMESLHPVAIQAQSSDVSGFLRLPLELRAKIYLLALGSNDLYFAYQEVAILASLHWTRQTRI